MIVVAALYKFLDLPHYQDVHQELQKKCEEWHIKGTLLLASEGINGTVAGDRSSIDHLKAFLKTHGLLDERSYKESFCEDMPFYRMKVRLKKEIVTLGQEGISPTKQVGTYVSPSQWNHLIQDPEVLVLDTRNDYEYAIGSFKGAIDPQTETFREFPHYVSQNLDPKVHKKVAMFCTGGIRCEKASSYMLAQGFENVYHLDGGILKYLECIPADESLWEGECFVFDNRVAVSHGLEVGHHDQCYGCRYPLSLEDKKHPDYKEGVHCGHCYHRLSPHKIHRMEERHRQVQLAKSRGLKHIGATRK
jgi:UPF0176 protein